MKYCCQCRTLVNIREEETPWNKKYMLVCCFCETCNIFLYQYLKEI